MSHDAEHTTPVPAAGSHAPLVQWEWVFLIGVFVFALSLRLAYLTENRASPLFEHPRLDGLYHDRLAQQIAAGNVIGSEVYFRAPLYPYALAFVYAIAGHDYIIPRVAQHLLGALVAVLIYLLARRLFSRSTAIIAALVTATYAMLVYIEGELLFESFLTFLTVLWLGALYRAKNRVTIGRWIGAGLLFGLTCITRPIFLPFIIPMVGMGALVQLPRAGRGAALRTAIALFAGSAIIILPVTIRNYVVSGDFVPIASQGGINFYIGNNPDADGYSSAIPGELGRAWEISDQEYVVERAIGRKPSPSEVSDYWYEQGFSYILGNPVRAAGLFLKKLYLFWNHIEIPNNQSFYSAMQHASVLRWLPTGFWLIGPLGLLGMVLAWQARRGRFMTVFVLMYAALTALFFVCDRFRVPVIPVLSMFAAYAAVTMVRQVNDRHWARFGRNALLLVLFGFFVNSTLFPVSLTSESKDQLALGIVALEGHKYDVAIEHFKRSSSEGPLPNVHLNWGVAELMQGNFEPAAEHFRHELSLFPNSYGAVANLAYLKLVNRQLDSVSYYARVAAGRKPFMPAPYIYAAQAFQLEDNVASAESTLTAGKGRCGERFLYGELLLASLHREMGRLDDAEQAFRSLVKRLQASRQLRYEPEFDFSEESVTGGSRVELQSRVLYELGHVFVARGQLDSSAAYFRQATEASPDFADAWADLGVALLNLRQAASAVEVLQRALALSPDDYRYWFNYGSALGTAGEFEKAREAFNKVLELQPDFEPARARLQLTLKQLER